MWGGQEQQQHPERSGLVYGASYLGGVGAGTEGPVWRGQRNGSWAPWPCRAGLWVGASWPDLGQHQGLLATMVWTIPGSQRKIFAGPSYQLGSPAAHLVDWGALQPIWLSWDFNTLLCWSLPLLASAPPTPSTSHLASLSCFLLSISL